MFALKPVPSTATNNMYKTTNSKTKADDGLPKAEKDCKVCNRRRIKCDRALPTCNKCKGRCLDCPGYGLVLKWGQGVASRGKLAGKSLPIRFPEHALQTSNKIPSPPKSAQTSPKPKPTHGKHARSKSASKPQSFAYSSVMRVNVDHHSDVDADFEEDSGCSTASGPWDDWQLSFNTGVVNFFDNKPTMVPSPPSSIYSMDFNSNVNSNSMPELDLNFDIVSQLPLILQNPSVKELLQHYDQIIAPLMVWIDTPTNPWRKIIIPLAMQSPTLLLSLLAVAAQHISAQSGGHHPMFTAASAKYRDTALLLITERLKIESDALGFSEQQDPAFQIASKMESNATLGAIIMLCNYEMVDPHTNAWRTHLDAARTMIKLRGGSARMGALNDETSSFLLSQFFVIDVFASTTTFSSDDMTEHETQHLEPNGHEGMFEDFLRVMHQVTRWERQSSNPERSPPAIPPPDAIQTRFESARLRTLKSATAVSESLSPRQNEDFTHLVNVYHHSGLLYSWRALYDFGSSHPLVLLSKRELYNSLNLIRDTKHYAQDIVYPLFIMGTESVGDDIAQEMVEWRMKEAMSITGFKNCESALGFLDAYWTQGDSSCSWVKFAREWDDRGNSFLVY